MATQDGRPVGYRFLDIVQPDIEYVTKKPKSARAYYQYLLSRIMEMFEYKNMPDTIPHDIFDRYLMLNGIACITKDPDDKLRVFYGNLGGVQDCYYRPTQFIIANPHFKETFSKNCIVLGEEEHDGVLMRNDFGWVGLHPMLSRYSCLMAENILTLRVADVMLRITALLSAPSDKEYKSAMEYIKSLEDGNLKVIAENAFFDGIKLQSPPSNNGSYLTQFIEYQQYLKGSFYNEVGLSANYNMKREAIGKGESTLDQDALLPLCENMLKCRREDLAQVNAMYGTEITVDFSSSWKENMLQSKLLLLQMASASQLTTNASEGEGNVGTSEVNTDLTDTVEEEEISDEIEATGGDESTVEDDSVENGSEIETEEDGTSGSEINDVTVDEAFAELDKVLDEVIGELAPADPSQLMNEGGEDNESGEFNEDEEPEDQTDNTGN